MPDDPFVAHDVPDLINSLPALFGFTPEESVVAIATHGSRNRMGFRMRMDVSAFVLAAEAADLVVSHLRRNGAEGAIVLAVADDVELGETAVWAIENRLDPVLPVIGAWADGERYWTTFDDCDPDGHPYETTDHHESVVRAIAAGQEILPNRAALAAKLEPDGGERRFWLNAAIGTVVDQTVAALSTRGERSVEDVAMADLTPALDALHAGRPLTDDQSLRLALWATIVPARDALWALITPDSARSMVGLWSHVARCAPPGLSAPSLSLAAFASWQAGDGALALIAAEKALELDPEYPLAGLMLQTLERGIAPSAWWSRGRGEQASA